MTPTGGALPARRERRRLFFGWAALMVSAGCGGGDAAVGDAAVSDAMVSDAMVSDAVVATDDPNRPGLRWLAAEPAPDTLTGSPHLVRVVLRPGRAWVANSSSGVMTWGVDSGQGFEARSSTVPFMLQGPAPKPAPAPRCTALAAPPSGRALYCAAADGGLSWFDLRDPDHPATGPGSDLSTELRPGYRDLYAQDDVLWLAAFRRGLLRARLGADGRPEAPEPVGVNGDIVGVGGEGQELVVLDRTRGLVRLRREGDGVVERDALRLDGPLLGLRVRGEHAVVSLGSMGAAVVRLSGASMEVVARVRPPAVVTSADLRGEALALGSMSGVWLYAVKGATTRLAGFDPAEHGVLDVAFTEDGRLVALDWRSVLLFRVDVGGHSVLPDVDDGTVVGPGVDARIVARNPGDRPLQLALEVHGAVPPGPGGERTRERAVVAPGETVRFTVPAAQLQAWGDLARGQHRFIVTSEQGRALRRSHQGVVVVAVPSQSVGRDALPVVGSRFPRLSAQRADVSPREVPDVTPASLVFVLPDCALQWPPLEDLAWSWATGHSAHPQPFVLTVSFARGVDTWNGPRFMSLWGADALGGRPLGDYLDLGGRPSGEVFDQSFAAREIGGADFTDVYELDQDGVVREVDRHYRGAWALR